MERRDIKYGHHRGPALLQLHGGWGSALYPPAWWVVTLIAESESQSLSGRCLTAPGSGNNSGGWKELPGGR